MGVSTDGEGISFKGDKNVFKLIVVMVAQLGEYTKKHGLSHFKGTNCLAGELCDNKASTSKQN